MGGLGCGALLFVVYLRCGLGLIDIGCFGVVVVLVDSRLLLRGLDVCC